MSDAILIGNNISNGNTMYDILEFNFRNNISGRINHTLCTARSPRRYNHKSYVLPCPSDHLAPRWSAEHTFINHKELLSQYLLDCWCTLLFNIRCGVLSGYYCNKSRAPRKMQSARLSIFLSCALCPAPLILGMVSSHGTLRVVVVVVVFLILFCY